MKRRLAAFVGILCIACLIASGAYAKGKPDKPAHPHPECIVFTGVEGHPHLQSAGETIILGCCPNAGPGPAYTMALNLAPDGSLDADLFPDTFYDGYMFLGGYGRNEGTKVQFWTWDWEAEEPGNLGNLDYFFEIRGGDFQSKKEKQYRTETVTFDGSDPATVWVYYEVEYPDCDPCDPSGCDPCPQFEHNCDPCSDPDCDPCIDCKTVSDVRFELVRTSDLAYCAALR